MSASGFCGNSGAPASFQRRCGGQWHSRPANESRWPPASGDGQRPSRLEHYAKMAARVAEKAHTHLQELTGKKLEFPKQYNEQTRAELKQAFEEPVKEMVEKANKLRKKR